MCKRLVKRESINVQFELPDGNKGYDIKAGSNLRGEMIRLGVPVGLAFVDGHHIHVPCNRLMPTSVGILTRFLYYILATFRL